MQAFVSKVTDLLPKIWAFLNFADLSFIEHSSFLLTQPNYRKFKLSPSLCLIWLNFYWACNKPSAGGGLEFCAWKHAWMINLIRPKILICNFHEVKHWRYNTYPNYIIYPTIGVRKNCLQLHGAGVFMLAGRSDADLLWSCTVELEFDKSISKGMWNPRVQALKQNAINAEIVSTEN